MPIYPAASGAIKISANNANALQVTDGTNDVANVNGSTGSQRLEVPNGAKIRMFSDAYSTNTLDIAGGTITWGSAFDTYMYRYAANILALSGTMAVGQSGSAATIASAGTITTSGIGLARVTTAGNVTGVILQAGVAPGQELTVVNESANTLTMAASGTSNVADGVSDVISAISARSYIWDGGTSLWYKCA